MPSKYLRKINRCFRSPTNLLQEAATQVSVQGVSIRKAAANFGVDKMTLHRYMKITKVDPNCEVGYSSTSSKNRVIPLNMEKDLASHISYLADMYYGLTVEKCKELAYEFAVKNSLSVPLTWHKNAKAGKQWWLAFKRRQSLTVRSPEATSIGRASAFNHHTVTEYFENLAKVLDSHKFTADRIFNIDETGVTTVQKPKKVVTTIGTRNVGAITSAERGELVTAVYAICAAGYVLAPMLIFPRVRYYERFISGAPPGTVGKSSKSGWINEQIFVEFLVHIADLTGCSPERKILIIMDNHHSHVSLASIDKARERGIVLLTIPPHTSHKLQPLDKTVFGPFKASYNRAMDNMMRSQPGKRIDINDIAKLVNEAHLAAMVPRNILSGFLSTGNWPYNSCIFTEADFAPAVVTDRPFVPESSGVGEPNHESPRQSAQLLLDGSTDQQSVDATDDIDSSVDESVSGTAATLGLSYMSPSDIMPIPKAAPRKQTNRRRGKTRIFTESPVRAEVEKRQKEKKLGVKRKLLNKRKKIPIPVESSSSEEDDVIQLDDDSDDSMPITEENIEVNLGDYVVVLVSGRSRTLKCIARVDDFNDDDGEYEGVFLQKVNRKLLQGEVNEGPTFIVNEEDAASFAPEDIILKLPDPVTVGGSARRSNKLRFDYNFKSVALA